MNDKRIKRGILGNVEDRRAGEGEGHGGRFRFGPVMVLQKGQSQSWKGLGMSVNLSRTERANRPMGGSGWGCPRDTTDVLHKRQVQGGHQVQ